MSEGTSGKLTLENLNFLMGLRRVGSSQVKDLTVEKERLIIISQGSERIPGKRLQCRPA